MMFDHLKNQDMAKTLVAGVVVDNRDPFMARRLRVRVEGIHDEVPDAHLPWAAGLSSTGRGPNGKAGAVAIPAIGSDVGIIFQQGDSQNPMYTGGLDTKTNMPAVFEHNYPNRSGFVLPNGTTFYVDEVDGDLYLSHTKSVTKIDKDGNVSVVSQGSLSLSFKDKIDIHTDSTVNVNCGGTATVTAGGATTVKSPSVTLDSPDTQCTGNLTVAGAFTFKGGMTGSGGGGATLAGSFKLSGGDITADGISLKSHGHMEQGDGSRTSSAVP